MAKLSQQNQIASVTTNITSNNNNGVTKVKRTRRTVPRDSPPQRSSIYRGVTRHRWTGRYEAHLWDKNSWNESQNKKGRQVYLGAYDDEEAAAHSYDLAALKYWGPDTILNFPVSTYEKELREMEGQSREEYIGSLRRKSSGFSRGVSKYRGVARHHHNGRWEARIGRVFGNKYLYLGTYATQEEAAMAYDMAAIEYRGFNAVTNFDLSRYIKRLKPDQLNGNSMNSNMTTNMNNSFDRNLMNPKSQINDDYSTTHNNNPNQEFGLNFFQQESQVVQQQTYTHQPEEATLGQQPHPMVDNATSALGLLLQSPKFKELMEMTTVSTTMEYPMTTTVASTNSSSMDQKTSSVVIDPPQFSFPEDVKPCIDYQDFMSGTCGGSSNDEHDFFFGNLNSYEPQMFQFDFDS